ncbi:MAG: galactokinase [Candidatus Izemoplasmatales bacterium]|nr:galactokinase [Candidatus Izemoplasmatales bacterium]
MKKQMLAVYKKVFGEESNPRLFFSPGRVNLIGEHIDYNGGFVFPCALSIGTYGAISLRNDRLIRLYSENFATSGVISISLDDLEYQKSHTWANYLKGVIRELLLEHKPILSGFNIAIDGDLPCGAGLSSSASIELLVAVMMNDLFCLNIPRKDLALLCKKVENEYIGVNCGIMDQFVIALGKAKNALLLDCVSLDYTFVPLNHPKYAFVIVNSKVKRGLVDSKYNERRRECETAKKILQKYIPISELCDLNEEQFQNYGLFLIDPVLYRRAKHAVTENARTINANHQLLAGDLHAFGEAMIASHWSLSDDFEVSCPELDFLVKIALLNGSIGSRMTGAGFGGCTINIVKNTDIDYFKSSIITQYKDMYGIDAEIYIAQSSDGTKEITI